jgi:CHASE2 domain-containing sensor protein
MSYCVVCVLLFLYGSLPPVVCSIGGLMSYCVTLLHYKQLEVKIRTSTTQHKQHNTT